MLLVTSRCEQHGSVPLRSWLAMLPSDPLAGKPALPLGLEPREATPSVSAAASVLPATFRYDHCFTGTGGGNRIPTTSRLAARTLRASAIVEVVAA
ncbi:hypothetical protein E1161_19280 [Saccharopolyspora aridisoli]|uniref:Uncharacterized protein n=1 Tax=Saccharopolyspora aridisoli TaxID=2530385 RepID=A0A4R4UF48_9PSEU|nr:hypothetical protein [Saccharopolyspora aridisoli]TDC90251.1 hypothetical protein E1161_19280 [Saccharopolyspora aridisoli]